MRSDGDAGGGVGRSLGENPAFLRSVVENTRDGLLTIDTTSVVVFANPAVEDILGYAPHEIIGRPLTAVIPGRLRDDHRDGLGQYLATGERHVDWSGVELRALHADGHEVPVSVRFREHEFGGDRLFTGIFTDVSERERRERRLREQKRELEEFADVLSTDLRRPLADAREGLASVRDRRDDPELDGVDRSLERAEHVIRDTLSRARHGAERDPAEFVSLATAFRSAWADVEAGEATLALPDDAWRVHADRRRLERLAENLLRNAVEHGGSTVSVRVGVIGDGEGFFVEDDGPGFPESVLDGDETAGGPSDGGYGLHVVGGVAAEHTWTTEFTESDAGGARVEFQDASLFRWSGDLPDAVGG